MPFGNSILFSPFIDDKTRRPYLKKISCKFTEEELWRRIFSLATSQSKQHFMFFIIFNYSFVCEGIGSPGRSILSSALKFVSLNLRHFFHVLSIFDCSRTLVSHRFGSRVFFIFVLNFLFDCSLRNLGIFFDWWESVWQSPVF